MKYPTVSDYIESVYDISSRLRTIENVEPLYNQDGEPAYTSSHGRVTFFLKNGSKVYKMTCFTSSPAEAREREYLKAGVRRGDLYEMEIFVFPEYSFAGDYFPVIISDYEENSVPDGTESAPTDISDIVESRKPVCKDGLWGFAEDSGRIVIQPKYDSVDEFSEGRATVGLNGMMGLVDRNGNEIVPVEYDELSWDGGVLVYADRCGQKGCLDRMGEHVVPCIYDWIGEFHNGMMLVVKDGKHGYVGLDGSEVLPLIYDGGTSFDENGFALVDMGSRRVMIDRMGREVQ